jgi:Rho termination factor, N-terminal domain
MPTPQIKDEKTYQALRREGNSEEKSARIANAAANSSRKAVGRRGGKSPAYDEWTKDDLMKRAREIGIKGRSSMTKQQLISALRSH